MSTKYTLRTPENGLGRYVGEPRKHGRVEVEIDFQAIIRELGSKAAFNKTGKSRALHGAIVVKFKEQK